MVETMNRLRCGWSTTNVSLLNGVTWIEVQAGRTTLTQIFNVVDIKVFLERLDHDCCKKDFRRIYVECN